MIILWILDLVNFMLSITIFPVFSTFSGILSGGFNLLASFGWIISIIQPAIRFFSYILGSNEAMSFILTLSFVLMPVEILASLAWWILGKLPFINIQKK
ncbi:MAG: hypothetical protein Q4A21_01040 [bacterium]|nr:hypothetical protein [bacterium]